MDASYEAWAQYFSLVGYIFNLFNNLFYWQKNYHNQAGGTETRQNYLLEFDKTSNASYHDELGTTLCLNYVFQNFGFFVDTQETSRGVAFTARV
jgi:hypothetical protein